MNNTCPSCGSVYGVTPQHVGREFSCRKCNAALVVREGGLELVGGATEAMPPQTEAMQEEDLGATARVAPRSRRGGGGALGDYLTFRKMIVPLIIQIIFWLLTGSMVLAGLIFTIYFGLIQHGGFLVILQGLIFLVGGPLIVRIYCELIIVAFRINDTLTDIKNILEKK